jgi:hypothetical protein
LAEAPLQAATLRLVAERLAPTSQGAALAARVWPPLLRAEPVDADGWTLFAEALRHLGREAEATLADGFGAALTTTRGPAPAAPERPLAGVVPSSATPPEGCVPIGDETMPRLSAALLEALRALGVDGVQPVLDPAGGVEAWLAGSRLVLGAGALTVFGHAELPFLVALALRLGEGGHALRGPAAGPGFDQALTEAFEAYPASLAACRVAAHLADAVRGGDHRGLDVGAVLRSSSGFVALTGRALEWLG